LQLFVHPADFRRAAVARDGVRSGRRKRSRPLDKAAERIVNTPTHIEKTHLRPKRVNEPPRLDRNMTIFSFVTIPRAHIIGSDPLSIPFKEKIIGSSEKYNETRACRLFALGDDPGSAFGSGAEPKA
jgi:hypothetical protein